MVLNRNPKNYFAEIEQSAFNPASMVPGIEASPDKMLQVQYSYMHTVVTYNTVNIVQQHVTTSWLCRPTLDS